MRRWRSHTGVTRLERKTTTHPCPCASARLAAAGNTYNRDYFGESAQGAQQPMLNVFRRDGEAIHHFWGSELFSAPTEPGQGPRHVDSIDPQWNLFDLTPEGRGTNWYPELSYS